MRWRSSNQPQRLVGGRAAAGAALAALCLGAATASAATRSLCDAGLNAFRTTVHPKIMRDCNGCHAGDLPNSPPFAVPDVEQSYRRLAPYVRWGDMAGSPLVFRAGNAHCGSTACDAASGEDMLRQVAAWWTGGQRNCPSEGEFFSAEVPVPDDLPNRGEGFTTLQFDLSNADPSLAGLSFLIDMQDFILPSRDGFGAYRFRYPRLAGGQGSIAVKGVHVFLNDAQDATADAYVGIDRKAGFHATAGSMLSSTVTLPLSPDALIVLKDGQEQPKLRVSFERLERGGAMPQCSALASFEPVMAKFTGQNCASCHDAANAAAPAEARTFDLRTGGAATCARALELLDRRPIARSTLVALPVTGAFEHPRMSDADATEYMQLLRAWATAEGRP